MTAPGAARPTPSVLYCCPFAAAAVSNQCIVQCPRCCTVQGCAGRALVLMCSRTLICFYQLLFAFLICSSYCRKFYCLVLSAKRICCSHIALTSIVRSTVVVLYSVYCTCTVQYSYDTRAVKYALSIMQVDTRWPTYILLSSLKQSPIFRFIFSARIHLDCALEFPKFHFPNLIFDELECSIMRKNSPTLSRFEFSSKFQSNTKNAYSSR